MRWNTWCSTRLPRAGMGGLQPGQGAGSIRVRPEEIAITSTKIARAHPELAPTAGSPVQAVPPLRRCGGRGGLRRLSTALLVTERPSAAPDRPLILFAGRTGRGWDGLAVSSTRA